MTRTLVLHAQPRREHGEADLALAEVTSLAQALDLDVVESIVVPIAKATPATLFGSGKVAELAARIADAEVALAIVNGTLTPVQQRNLEREWKVKVLDRTGLILEIFGARAQTREGVMQVELAHLTYQKSRLVRSWTHLERQRGGMGFMGGPGETQIEADRRLIDEKIVKLKRQLEKVAQTRALHRAARKRRPSPVVALVGYTNAGKSTLFNTMTEAGVLAQDMLFATLDPTMRQIALPSGRHAILSDTVGFISDLPVQLVAAFRATLEEVLEADLIVHVRDIAHPQSRDQRQDVLSVLEDLGLDAAQLEAVLEVRNKIDILSPDLAEAERGVAARTPDVVAVSAVTGEGIDALLQRIEERLFPRRFLFEFALAHSAGAAVAWLHAHAEVLDRTDTEDGVVLRAEMTEMEFFQFQKVFGEGFRVVRQTGLAAQ